MHDPESGENTSLIIRPIKKKFNMDYTLDNGIVSIYIS